MTQRDDQDEDQDDEFSPERDWDRNISEALAALRESAQDKGPPTLDPTHEFPAIRPEGSAAAAHAAQPAPQPSGALSSGSVSPGPGRPDDATRTAPERNRLRIATMAGFSILGLALVGVALWPRVESSLAGDPGAASVQNDPPSRPVREVPASAADQRLPAAQQTDTPLGVTSALTLPARSGADAPGPRAAVPDEAALVSTTGGTTSPAGSTGARIAALEASLAAAERQRAEAERRAEDLEVRLSEVARDRDSYLQRIQLLEAEVAERETVDARTDGVRAAEPGSGSPGAAPSTDVTPGAWTVSLMTLSQRASAEAYANRVREAGWPADVTEVGRQGGLWRVSSGDFASRAEADGHAASVAANLDLDSVWVTRRP